MNDALRMRRIQRIRNLQSPVPESSSSGQRLACNPVLQRLPLQKFHHDEGDVRHPRQSRESCRCSDDSAPKPPAPRAEIVPAPAIPRHLIRQEFQRHRPVQPGVFSLINHTHPAAAQFFQDAVVRNTSADKRGRFTHKPRIVGREPSQVNARPSQSQARFLSFSRTCRKLSVQQEPVTNLSRIKPRRKSKKRPSPKINPRQKSQTKRPPAGRLFEDLLALQARLRAPNGCPWDREQTHATLRTFLLEETHEVLDAMDSGDPKKFADELGDLLLQIIFHALIASESNQFEIRDVIESTHTKMIRRHPHVFGNVKAKTSAQVLKNWEQLKAEERRKENGEGKPAPKKDSILSSVPRALPALMEAHQITRRAANIGFDWNKIEELLEKLEEEMRELKVALASPPASDEENHRKSKHTERSNQARTERDHPASPAGNHSHRRGNRRSIIHRSKPSPLRRPRSRTHAEKSESKIHCPLPMDGTRSPTSRPRVSRNPAR